MALFPLHNRLRSVIYDTHHIGNATSLATQGQHFLQSPRSRTFSLRDLNGMSDADVEMLFRKMRWSDSDGEPVCPVCGTLDHWRLENQNRWKCKSCHKQFSVTSGTIFAYRKMPLRDILTGIRTFILNAKGNSAIALSKELGCDYKTAFVMQHKLREALMVSMEDIRLEGEIEIDGGWFGGYIKPENTKINRVDRRLAANQNGKRRVIVGARERGPEGRAVVAVFDNEWNATAWLRERCSRSAHVFADEGAGWLDLHASHKVSRVNHSERYADGPVNTNQMENLFSRLRRIEVGTHHHIAGPYLVRYANDGVWRENNRRVDDLSRVHKALSAALNAKQSRSFGGYWQHHGSKHIEFANDDFLANFG
jgi:transposase-like protein